MMHSWHWARALGVNSVYRNAGRLAAPIKVCFRGVMHLNHDMSDGHLHSCSGCFFVVSSDGCSLVAPCAAAKSAAMIPGL